jgi:CoA:oxalate CoA-transferase
MSSLQSSGGPLSGLLVVDLTRVLAGPYATMLLADLGARVIKVEAPETGDDSRAIGPFMPESDGTDSAYFTSVNRGKESLALDLKAPADRALFEALLAKADILVENFRPGAMERLGYGFEALHARYPRLIYAAASGFGHTGPESRRPAYDVIVQAMGGIMSITGPEPAAGEAPLPVRVGTSLGDITAGLFTVIGIEAALLARHESGRGQKVDVAMLDCQIAILENAIARYQVTGRSPAPLGTRHPSITPFQAFRTADRPIVVAAGNDQLWAACCTALGLEALAADPRFATNDSRTSHAAALAEALEARLSTAPAAHWLEALGAAGVPAGPLNSVGDALAMPQVAARNMLVETRTPGGRTLKVAGNPVKLSAHPDPASRPPAPALDSARARIEAEFGGRA